MSSLVAPHIEQARETLAKRRAEIRQMHDAGASGAQVVAALTVLIDGIVTRLARIAAEYLSPAAPAEFESTMALVALGGYGRAELAPFSDIDLMFLHEPAVRATAGELCSRLFRDLWDSGLQLGSSLRTHADCVSLARKDTSIHTALLEARHVAGNSEMTSGLREQVLRLTRGSRADEFITRATAERLAEQAKAGPNVHLLEPDLKRSKGGLRELHLMRWVSWARHSVAGIDRLERAGLLSEEDAAALATARELLLRIRNDLHFRAGRAADPFTFDEQVRLAAAFHFDDRPGMLAVERFMQNFYRHSAAIDDGVSRFIERCRGESAWRRWTRPLRTQRIETNYLLCGGELVPTPAAAPAIERDLERIVRLFAMARAHDAVVEHDVCERIRKTVAVMNDADATAARRVLLELLAEPSRLAPTLRALNSAGVLERLIPEFGHVHGLIQFNQYHKYTVEEHTLLCIANAEAWQHDHGPLGQVYRDIRHKEILHLALLLHDLGKGHDADHSELGRRIATDTAARFGLDTHLTEMLVFLVHKHLLMAHLAFRRDTSDERLLASFARDVGTPEVLKMLFVLTAADIASVGPGMFNSWKLDVLTDLFARTMERLTGDVAVLDVEKRLAESRNAVARQLADAVPDDWLRGHLESMPRTYLFTTPADHIAEHLRVIHTLPAGDAITTGVYDPETKITAYTVYTWDSITPGLFSKIAGVLAAKGLQILSAQITTYRDDVVVDRFEVLDFDYAGEPHRQRFADIGATIRAVLRGERSIENVFAHSARIGSRRAAPAASLREPTKVLIDNDSSEHLTIIEVFANDRQGLLFVITRTIFELGLSVATAKVATALDQVLDVFYVTDQAGVKVTDEARHETIRSRLITAIEAFEASAHRATAS